MTISSMYRLSEYPYDKDWAVVGRIKNHLDEKLLLFAYDPNLDHKLDLYGIDRTDVINVYDYIQGVVGYADNSVSFDMRVLPRYDKSDVIFDGIDTDKEHYMNVLQHGNRVAKIDYRNKYIRMGEVELIDKTQRSWIKDIYDVRGFLSKRQFFNHDGKLGLELYYHISGVPVLEVSHMDDKVMYRFLGTCGFDNWILNNELSMMYYVLQRMFSRSVVVYNHDPMLDSLFSKADNVVLERVAHVQDLTNERIKELQEFSNVYSVNKELARFYGYKQLDTINGIHYDHKFDGVSYRSNDVAIYNIFIDKSQVDTLVNAVSIVYDTNPDVIFRVFGHFSVDVRNYLSEVLTDKPYQNNILLHGNLLGSNLESAMSSCSFGLWLPYGTYCDYIPALMNSIGLPVITNVDGFSGAKITSASDSKLLARAVLFGLENAERWRSNLVRTYG